MFLCLLISFGITNYVVTIMQHRNKFKLRSFIHKKSNCHRNNIPISEFCKPLNQIKSIFDRVNMKKTEISRIFRGEARHAW